MTNAQNKDMLGNMANAILPLSRCRTEAEWCCGGIISHRSMSQLFLRASPRPPSAAKSIHPAAGSGTGAGGGV